MEGRAAPLVKLVAAVLYGETAPLEQCLERLAERFSALDFRGTAHPFTHTDYYEPEMGAGLSRCIVAFTELVPPGALVRAQHEARAVEQALSREGRRRVNVDMGYLDLYKLVLASCKGRGNKLYLDEGVWADMTLIYEKGRFRPLPWTFPDFRAGAYDGDLSSIRDILKAQARETG